MESLNNNIHQILNGLTKEEIIELIKKYSSNEFKKTILLKYIKYTSNETKSIIEDIENELDDLFKNEQILYSPDLFDSEVVEILQPLKGFSNFKDFKNLILFVIKEIDNLQDNGYLYEDYSDYTFEGIEFSNFLMSLLEGLNSKDKIDFFIELVNIQNILNYDIFNIFDCDTEELLNYEELIILKNNLNKLNKFNEKIYDLIKPVLTEEEIINLLEKYYLLSSKMTYDLATIYEKSNSTKSKEIIDEVINFNFRTREEYFVKLFKKRVDLSETNDEKYTILIKMLTVLSEFSTLIYAIYVLPNNKIDFEKLLKDKNINEYFLYLEKEHRLIEANNLINNNSNIYEGNIFEFYSNHGKKFVDDSSKYFQKYIENNLKEVGDMYYKEIEKALIQLKKIDIIQYQERINFIKTNFNRRRNLIKLIDNIK